MNDKINKILSIWTILSSFYLEQILSAVRPKICPLRPKFVKSRQTIRTCRRLVVTEILSKQTTFSQVRIGPLSVSDAIK